MSKMRRLTPEEKAHWHDVVLAKEQHDFPGYQIDVTILDETDDDGEPLWRILKQREIEMPKGWKPE